MKSESEFAYDPEEERSNESETRSGALPLNERRRDYSGIFRNFLISAVCICDLKYGWNPLTIAATILILPLIPHIND